MSNSSRNSYIISKGFRNYFTSSIFLMVAEQICATVDMILVGNFVSADAFSALDLALPVESLVHGIFLLAVGGAGTIAARLTGNQDFDGACKILSLTTAAVSACAILMSILGLTFLDGVTSLLCNDPDLAIYLKTYLKAFFYGLAPMALYSAMSEILNVDGKPGVVTAAATIACVVDIVLDIVFMKLFGMGVAGQAYATIVSYVLPILIFTPYFVRGKSGFRFIFPKRRHIFTLMRRIVEAGIPFCTPYAVSFLMLVLVNWIVLTMLGSSGLYVWSVGYQVYSIGIMFMDCVGGTVLITMGGMLAGCHDSEGLKFLLKKVLQATGAVIGAVTLAVWLFPSAAIAAFGEGDVVQADSAVRNLRLISLILLPFSFASIKAYICQVLGRDKVASASFFMISIIIVPALYIWSMFDTQWMFAAIPLAELLWIGIDFILAERIRRRKHPEFSRYFLIPNLNRDNTIYLSVPYTPEGRDKALADITEFLDSCDLQPGTAMGVNLCCEEMILELLSHNKNAGEGYFFDIFIINEEENVKVTVKDAGMPFNPVKKFDKEAGALLQEGEMDEDISLRIINKFCRELNYNFMYGQNVVFMMFRKN